MIENANCWNLLKVWKKISCFREVGLFFHKIDLFINLRGNQNFPGMFCIMFWTNNWTILKIVVHIFMFVLPKLFIKFSSVLSLSKGEIVGLNMVHINS